MKADQIDSNTIISLAYQVLAAMIPCKLIVRFGVREKAKYPV